MLKELLHTFHLEDIQSTEHPSDFIVKDPYNILILRLPEVHNERIETVSYAFVVHEQTCYLYDRESEELNEVGSLVQMNDFLDDKIELLIKKVKSYHYEVENLEEALYDENYDSTFMEKWLTYKKILHLSTDSCSMPHSHLNYLFHIINDTIVQTLKNLPMLTCWNIWNVLEIWHKMLWTDSIICMTFIVLKLMKR